MNVFYEEVIPLPFLFTIPHPFSEKQDGYHARSLTAIFYCVNNGTMAKGKKGNPYPQLILGIIILLLMAVAFLTYKIYGLSLKLVNSQVTTGQHGLDAITSPVSQNELSKTAQGINTFTHPNLGYTVTVPDLWTPRIYHSLAGTAIVPYEDIIFLSPDYKQTIPNVVTPILESGASIFIRGAETNYTTIEERFANNIVAQKVATNVVHRSINGIPVVQYEYELNGENVTNITLIKNGIWYLIKFQYADSEEKVRYARVVEQVASSLRPK